MEIPGVKKDNIEISLKKNVLSVNGYTVAEDPEGFSLARAEYEIGDYERSFRLSNRIEQDKIKAEEAKARKIAVKVT